MKKKVSVSILSSKNVIDDLIDLESTDVDYIHIDVMDSKFVKNKFDPYKSLNKLSYILKKRLDVHLMVQNPIKYIEKYATLNTEYITIHIELDEKVIDDCYKLIKSYGIKFGLAIKPNTDLKLLEKYIDIVDLILVMSVEPGMGGQPFIEEMTSRLLEIKKIIGKRKILLNVDGGINGDTISKVEKSDIVVSGSFIIKSDNFQEKIDLLR